MRQSLPPNPKLGLALLYAAIFAGIGVNMPFLPLWLQARGLGPAEIGLVLGAPLLVRIVSTMLVGEWADRIGRPVRMLRASAAAGLAFFCLLAAAEGFWALLIAAALAAAAVAPTIPLTDSLAVAAFRSRAGVFGPVRAWGSVAFIAGNVLGGIALAAWSAAAIIWLIVGMQALALASAFACVSDRPVHERPTKPPRSRLLLRGGLMLAVVAAALIQASHGAYYALGSVHWQALGLDGPAIGVLWSLGVIAEIALFWWSARLPARIGPAHLLAVGAGAAVLRWSAMAFDPGGVALVMLQLLHALTFAATYLGMMRAIAALAPPGLEARAQGVAAMLHAVAMAGAMALAGHIHAEEGAQMYLAMALIAAAGGLAVMAGALRSGSAP